MSDDWKKAVSLNEFTGNGAKMIYNPEEDGVTHINVYSKGQTELGRLMSNFTYSPFEHPDDGEFNSVEGYWYWLSTGDDRLRELHGFQAKKLGRELRGADSSEEANLFTDFRENIKTALLQKLLSNHRLRQLLRESELPFTHYYIMHDRVLDKTEDERWIMEHWERLRKELKK